MADRSSMQAMLDFISATTWVEPDVYSNLFPYFSPDVPTIVKSLQDTKKRYEPAWTSDMDLALRSLFPACVLCGCTEEDHIKLYGTRMHVDHVYPRSRGGKLEPGNVVILCKSCNFDKSNKDPKSLDPSVYERLMEAAKRFKDVWEAEHTCSSD